MEKISILLAALSFIGFTMAQKASDCAFKFPTLVMLDRCCHQIGGYTSYDIAYGKCLEQYKNTPRPQYCASRCALNETKMGNPDGSMNYDGFRAFLEENVKDPAETEHMIKTLKNCESIVEVMLKEPEYNTEFVKPCGPRVNLLHRCAASHGIINCPVQKWKKNDPYCEQILQDAKTCPF